MTLNERFLSPTLIVSPPHEGKSLTSQNIKSTKNTACYSSRKSQLTLWLQLQPTPQFLRTDIFVFQLEKAPENVVPLKTVGIGVGLGLRWMAAYVCFQVYLG